MTTGTRTHCCFLRESRVSLSTPFLKDLSTPLTSRVFDRSGLTYLDEISSVDRSYLS